MAITQDQIAEHLGISRVSVARALNGHRKVSEENRRRIQEAARELGYDAHTNRAARELAAQRYGHKLKNDIVAVFLPHQDQDSRRSAAFFSPLVDGIELQAELRGLDVFLHSPRNKQLPRLVQSGGVDGAICLTNSMQVIEDLKQLDLPVVTLTSFCNGVHGVAPDECEGMRLVTEHLIEGGHRRIAYLGHQPNYSASIRRIQGYCAALESHGLAIDEELIEATLWSPNHGGQGAARLLGRTGFTALVCHNDLIAMGAIRELENRGVRVPDDVSVAGFDDISTDEHFDPSVTSIAFDREAMGKLAVDMMLETGPASQARHQSVPVGLVVRASTRPLIAGLAMPGRRPA